MTMTLETQSWKLDAEKFDFRTTESIKRQPVMNNVAHISKTFKIVVYILVEVSIHIINQKCHQTFVQGLIK